MNKRLEWVNNILCFTLAMSQVIVIGHAIGSFDRATTGMSLFKALFWMVVGGIAFGVFMHCLLNKKPVWRLWE